MKYLKETYRHYNANPNNADEDDCVIRALSFLLNKDYDEIRDRLLEIANKNHREFFSDSLVFQPYLMENGVSKGLDLRKDNLTLGEFSLEYDDGSYFCICSSTRPNEPFHAVAVYNGDIYDTWDSSDIPILFAMRIDLDVNNVDYIDIDDYIDDIDDLLVAHLESRGIRYAVKGIYQTHSNASIKMVVIKKDGSKLEKYLHLSINPRLNKQDVLKSLNKQVYNFTKSI